jgi:hypothetical protein
MIGADPGGGRSNRIPGPARNMPYDWQKRPSYASGREKRAIPRVGTYSTHCSTG